MKQRIIFVLSVVMSLLITTMVTVNAKEFINTDVSRVYTEVAESEGLGVAGNFNLFILEDLDMKSTDTEGRMAVGNNVKISGFGIGDKVNQSSTRFDLIVGGDVDITATQNKSGNTLINNDSVYNVNAYGHLNNVDNPFRMDTKHFFQDVKEELYKLSKDYDTSEVNGESRLEYGAMKFIGTNSDYNIFEVNANDLKNAQEVKINVPAQSTVIVNIHGDDVRFPNGAFFYNDQSGEMALPYASTVLWNMPEATHLTTTSSGVFGSVLAPYADVSSDHGQINGNLIAKSLEGHIESHLHLFRPKVVPPKPQEEFTEINVSKKWMDDDNKANRRPGSIVVNLYKDGNYTVPLMTTVLSESTGWKHTFPGLKKWDQTREIVYEVREVGIDGYEPSYKKTGNTVEITNTYTEEVIERISLSVEKQWDDSNNKEGLRPKEIIISVIADRNYAFPVKTIKITPDQFGNWKTTISNLPKTINGRVIEYDIVEDLVSGYTSSLKRKSNEDYTLINKRDVEYRSLKFEKIWDDENDQDELRPKTIEVHLIKNEDFDHPVATQIVEADDQRNWKGTFENLEVFENGVEIKYTVIEKPVEYYESKITGTMDAGYIITNHHTPIVKDLKVMKRWDDNNDLRLKRSKEIIVDLYANQEVIETRVIKAEDQWTTVFEDLPVYQDSHKIEYTIVERDVEGYVSVVEKINDHEILITNTLEPERPIIPREPNTPKTGMNHDLYLWTSILAVSLIYLAYKKIQNI